MGARPISDQGQRRVSYTERGIVLSVVALLGQLLEVYVGAPRVWMLVVLFVVAIGGFGFLIAGRTPFGFPHTWLVPMSLLLWTGSAVVSFLGALISSTDEELLGFLGYAYVLVGASYLLPTYALQRRPGRIFLWIAFLCTTAAPSVVFNRNLAILQAAAVLLFAFAFVLALLRVAKGEIPAPPRGVGSLNPTTGPSA